MWSWSRSVSEFAGFGFPPGVIVLAARWYLRFGLSYRDVEELLLAASDRSPRQTQCRVRAPSRMISDLDRIEDRFSRTTSAT